MRIGKTLFIPLLIYCLYYYDLLTDFVNTITLFQNCHKYLGLASMSIMLSSYTTTVLYLIFQMEEKIPVAFLYPFHHSRNLMKIMKRRFLAVIRGEEVPLDIPEERIFMHNISFIEATSESVLQLCLTCLILREFGTSTDTFEKFMQLSGLLTSLLSIVLAFAKVRYIIALYTTQYLNNINRV